MYITIGMGFAAWLFDWPLVIQQSLFLPCLTTGRFICSIGGCIVVLATLPIAYSPLTIHHYPFTIHHSPQSRRGRGVARRKEIPEVRMFCFLGSSFAR